MHCSYRNYTLQELRKVHLYSGFWRLLTRLVQICEVARKKFIYAPDNTAALIKLCKRRSETRVNTRKQFLKSSDIASHRLRKSS